MPPRSSSFQVHGKSCTDAFYEENVSDMMMAAKPTFEDREVFHA